MLPLASATGALLASCRATISMGIACSFSPRGGATASERREKVILALPGSIVSLPDVKVSRESASMATKVSLFSGS
jgi:hypothetical protein